jgi:hypothetical protein
VTEEQPSLFDLPAVVRRMSDEASARGDAPWGYINWSSRVIGIDVRRGCPTAPGSFYGAVPAESLADVPGHATSLHVDARAKDLERLTDLQDLETLQIHGVGPRELAIIGRVTSIRLLSIGGIRATNLDALAGLKHLEHLNCTDSATLTSLGALSGLRRLRTLGLEHLRKLNYLKQAQRLTQLRGLAVSGSMWTHARVASFAPLASLRNLRSLHLTGVRVADGSLLPLTALGNLRVLTLSNWFRTEEFAALAAAFPDLEDRGYQSMWWVPPRPANAWDYDACKRCKASTRGMTIGKPTRHLCPRCDSASIAKFATRWDALVSAARREQGKQAGA